jgi:hypothetical protein
MNQLREQLPLSPQPGDFLKASSFHIRPAPWGSGAEEDMAKTRGLWKKEAVTFAEAPGTDGL